MSHDVRDFQTEVLDLSNSTPVLVDFWAEWCGPCKTLTPVLEQLAEQHQGEWELKKVNTEELPDIAGRYGVQSIPNVKLFVNGKIANEFVGALPKASIEQWLQTSIPDKFAGRLDEAESLIRQRHHEEARRLLEPILASSPDHERGRALLALALLFSDRRQALELVAGIDESSKEHELAESVRSFDKLFNRLDNPQLLPDSTVKALYGSGIKHATEGDFDKALEDFIEVIRRDRYYDDDGARVACIAIFKYLGEEDEVTRKHRRDFGNALYS